MKKILIKQRQVILPFCEGESEKMLFNFLKINYSNKVISFKAPEDLGGVRDFTEFKRKYLKQLRKLKLKPKKYFTNVKLLFIIDNDLDDSKKIADFILREGCLLQFCDPNTEAMILSIVGKIQVRDIGNKDFRKRCKDKFLSYFACEVHQLKDKQLKEMFTLKMLKNNLPVLYNLFIK
jgi:hypothetical protein